MANLLEFPRLCGFTLGHSALFTVCMPLLRSCMTPYFPPHPRDRIWKPASRGSQRVTS